MKCLDNIYTKQIKYNSPVLYQLESLKKEYEKLLKVSNEIIKTGSFLEECYFENQSAVLSDNEITFTGNLKFKTDSGNYFQNIPSSLKLNVQGSGEIVVDVGEDNKTLVFKLDEEFLSEISLMIENLETLSSNFNDLKTDYELLKSKFNSQIFDNFIGIKNTTDSKIDQIKHINNNFQITSNDGKSLLNIDEQLETISSFNKRLLNEDDIINMLKSEIIYDKTSENIDINKGYTAGLPVNADYDQFDFSEYKGVFFEFIPSNIENNESVMNTLYIDLEIASRYDGFQSISSNNSGYTFFNNINILEFNVFCIRLNSSKDQFHIYCKNHEENSTPRDNNNYVCCRIRGFK